MTAAQFADHAAWLPLVPGTDGLTGRQRRRLRRAMLASGRFAPTAEQVTDLVDRAERRDTGATKKGGGHEVTEPSATNVRTTNTGDENE